MAKTRKFLSLSFFITFLLSLAFFPFQSLSSSHTKTYLYGGCTQQSYTPNSPYESNLDSLLTSLVNSATYSSYNNFTILGSTQQDAVYGLYQCRGDLSMPDCATCVASAVTRTGDLCRQTCGGAMQLDGCFVKYDNATFLGVEDKTVVLKKCGPSVGYNPEAMGSRDAVLAGLVGSSGPFREGGSGGVRGIAQCTGDLSFGECQDCLSEAISRLKSDCGTADYGDMFLGKCYARYSTGGAHDTSKAHGKSNNRGAKTFAIIIGLLAGAAILIVFLAFLSKICLRQGK
ncbi:PREDICTED: cysteine-rich repeat secretory protein 60-like [Lupinus angustifolius]|uniref:cysteine-rich repeat secretory protein 60-like n=1 Tax=Lupinus angustifolius TaxID=3871 RepID=UPI00092F2BDB|nr:PREDICTED: cysteine-rich repeat secretory protein 60-like [Lupinus angustifolius]